MFGNNIIDDQLRHIIKRELQYFRHAPRLRDGERNAPMIAQPRQPTQRNIDPVMKPDNPHSAPLFQITPERRSI